METGPREWYGWCGGDCIETIWWGEDAAPLCAGEDVVAIDWLLPRLVSGFCGPGFEWVEEVEAGEDTAVGVEGVEVLDGRLSWDLVDILGVSGSDFSAANVGFWVAGVDVEAAGPCGESSDVDSELSSVACKKIASFYALKVYVHNNYGIFDIDI